MAQEVPVVEGAQAEELKAAVTVRVNGGIQAEVVLPHELGNAVRDQAQVFPGFDGARERSDALVGNLLVDHHTQQASRQLGVARLLADQRRRRTDRQLVELARAGTVAEPADGPCRHSQRVNAMEPLAHNARRHVRCG